MKRIFAKGAEAANKEDISRIENLINIPFNSPDLLATDDLNNVDQGLHHTLGIIPKNAPKNIDGYAVFYTWVINSGAKIQLAFDNFAQAFIRGYGYNGSSFSWTDWKQIGGVLSSLLSHLVPRKVAC